MLNFIKKLGVLKTILCVLVLFLAISGGLCVHYKNKAHDWQKYAAHQNYAQWQKLQTMAMMTETRAGTVENYHFNNGVLTSIFRLEPAFEGTDRHTTSFLGTVFDSMAYDLAYGEFEAEKRTECLALYQEMNRKMLEICNLILNQTENNTQAQIDLMNSRSELHKTVEKKIADFCNEYRPKVSETFGWD